MGKLSRTNTWLIGLVLLVICIIVFLGCYNLFLDIKLKIAMLGEMENKINLRKQNSLYLLENGNELPKEGKNIIYQVAKLFLIPLLGLILILVWCLLYACALRGFKNFIFNKRD